MVSPLLLELLSVASVAGQTSELKNVINIVAGYVKKNGYTVEEFESNGRPSILVYYGSKRPKKFKVIFNGHLDVVPALHTQFVPLQKGDKLYARGAQDMKSGAVCMIEVFCEHAKQLPYAVGLQLVTDEEIGGEDGTGHQRRSGVLAEHFISGESTGFAVNTDAKGACWVKLTAHGVSAHGAYPWNGMNALHRLHKAIDAVMKIYPVPLKEVWRTSVNLAKIETKNDAFNKVPDEATAFLDIRFTADDVHFKSKKIALAFLKKIVGSGISIECAQWGPPHHADSSGTLVRSLHAAIKKHVKVQPAQKTHGASDARFYSDAKTHAVCFGPIGGGLHTTAEWVSIRSISVYKDILREYLQSLV